MTHPLSESGEPSDDQLITCFRQTRTIAVVGLSPKPDRASHRVATYLQQVGFRIIPIRPAVETILGEPCFASLEEIPEEIGAIDIVNVFRQAKDTPPIAESAVHTLTRDSQQGARLFWLQSGIVNDTAMEIARRGRLTAVQNLCLMLEHQRLASFL